jgi:hypothetical protein
MLVVVQDIHQKLFPGSGSSAHVIAVLRVDSSGQLIDTVELEDAPTPVASSVHYAFTGTTLVSAERDGQTVRLVQHSLAGGAPVRTTEFEFGAGPNTNNALRLFDGQGGFSIAALRDTDVELIPFDEALEPGAGASLPFGDGAVHLPSVRLAPQAGGWTVAFHRPINDDGTTRTTEVVARHFDENHQITGNLSSTCAGRGTNAPLQVVTPADMTVPTVVWRDPPSSWMGLASF